MKKRLRGRKFLQCQIAVLCFLAFFGVFSLGVSAEEEEWPYFRDTELEALVKELYNGLELENKYMLDGGNKRVYNFYDGLFPFAHPEEITINIPASAYRKIDYLYYRPEPSGGMEKVYVTASGASVKINFKGIDIGDFLFSLKLLDNENTFAVYYKIAPPVSDFSISPARGYAAQKQWLNVGGAFELDNPNFGDDTPVTLYLSGSANAAVSDAIGEPLVTTKGGLLAAAEATESGVVKADIMKRGLGLLADNLAARTYYVNLKIGEGEGAAYVSQPYTVYKTAKEYAKAAMDDVLDYYFTPPVNEGTELTSETEIKAVLAGGGLNPMLQNVTYNGLIKPLFEAGYKFYQGKAPASKDFYRVYQPHASVPSLYMAPYKEGLATVHDTGGDWEAWIFPSLGSKYPHVTNGQTEEWDLTASGSLLSGRPFLAQNAAAVKAWAELSAETSKTWLDQHQEYLKTQNIKSTKDLYERGGSGKDIFRYVAALEAMGADPRNPFPDSEFNGNYIEAMTAKLSNGITWDEEGNPDFSQAKPKVTSSGNYSQMGMQALFFSYPMLALEMANASPEEGYTEELKAGLLNVAVTTVESYYPQFEGGNYEENPGATPGSFPLDVCAMASLPLCYAVDDPVYGERIKTIFEKMPAAFGGIVDSLGGDDFYGANSNSVAVAINALVSAGYTAEDLEDSKFQGAYQTLLSSLVNCQLADGSIAYLGGNIGNRMSTYQALGALGDLYNGQSAFTIHRDNYLANYPQYTDEGNSLRALMAGLPSSVSEMEWKDVVNVKATRKAYTEFADSLEASQKEALDKHFAAELAVLSELEANTGAAVATELAKLGSKEQIQISDQPHIEALAAAYNSLSEEEMAIANGADGENLAKLRDALIAINMWTAKGVSDFILSLPSAADVTEKDRNDIVAARAAYEALTEDQKALVDGATMKALRDAERALENLAAKKVVQAIANLPEPGEVRITDKDAIAGVRGSYDNLSAADQALVTNYSKLQRVESVLAALIAATEPDEPIITAQSVIEQINALPATEAVTAADKKAITSARAAYETLSLEDKSLIHADVYKKLTDAEAALAALEGNDILKDLIGQEKAWYYPAVIWCVDNSLFQGDDQGNFKPLNNISRAEFAQMIYNYYQDDDKVMQQGDAKSFNDVKANKWYYQAVTACAEAGIILGDDQGNFNPDQPIKRQDVALILMRIIIGQEAIDNIDVDSRLAELAAAGYKFTDFETTSAYAQKAMAAASGVIFFGNEGKLNPENNISRAETAQVMYNYLKK